MARQDPLLGMRFRVEIDGIAAAAFSEVTLGATSTEVIEYREGSDPARARKLAGLTRFGNVVLRRGMSRSLDLVNWHRQVVNGDVRNARRNVIVVVQDETGADVARFAITDAWPCKFDSVTLDAGGNEVLIEQLELANEGIERVD